MSMDKRDDIFLAENVNEQVEQLLLCQDLAQQNSVPGARTVAELRDVYHENASILGNAWARLAEHTALQKAPEASAQIRTSREAVHDQNQEQTARTHLSLLQSRHVSRPRKRRRVLELSLIAAVVLLTVASWEIFSLFFHQTLHGGPSLASTPTSVPANTPNPNRGMPRCSFPLSTESVSNIDWSASGKIAVASIQTNVSIFDGGLCQLITTYPLHSSGMRDASVAWSPDGQRLAVSRSEVEILDGSTGKLVVTYHPWLSTATQTMSTAPGLLARSGKRTSPLLDSYWGPGETPAFDVLSSTWSPDGQYIASAIEDPDHETISIQIWNPGTGQHLRTIARGHFSPPNLPLAWSPDGKYLAVAGVGSTNMLAIWNTSTWQVSASPPSAPIGWVVWSPDSQKLAVSTYTSLYVWNRDTGHVMLTFPIHQQAAGVISWSPDGRYITTEDKDIRLWDARTGHLVSIYQYNSPVHYPVQTISVPAWSPDSTMFAALVLEGATPSPSNSVFCVWNVN